MRTPLSRSTRVLLGFLVVAAFLLATEHRAHLFGVLPYLLLLACPILHRFGHGRHGSSRHGGDTHTGQRPDPPPGGTH